MAEIEIRVPRRIAWLLGLLSRRSCYRADGKPKVRYSSHEKAYRAAESLSRKTGRAYDVYRCWFRCRRWHVGGSVDR